jgi:hypothetical protein
MLTSVPTRLPSWLAEHWRGSALTVCLAAAILALRLGREDEQRRQKKELEQLAEKIANYAKETHQKFPTGDVVVSEEDLAGALHRSPVKVAKALRFLQNQQKVERAPLVGYWKLNIESE